jgi:transcriptional regulator with XRE-family HTH domain
MVASADRDLTAKGPLLARAIRGLRRLRGRKLADVVAALGMRKRTYEHFEGGFGPLNTERVHEVVEHLQGDPYGVLAALEICSPDFALRTADNKLMTIFYLQLQEFDERAGDGIALLDSYCLMDAFREMFQALEAEARRRKELAMRRPPGAPPP